MNRAYRDQCLARVNPRLLEGSALADGIAREYTLEEIAIVTRAAPARLLGLPAKGTLVPGADADVTVYAPGEDASRTFASPRYVIKGGTIVVEEGELRRAPAGRRLYVQPAHDREALRPLREWWRENATMEIENFGSGPLRDEPLMGAPS